eukprot:TRINITY_DN169_c2_g1_i1.p1 TRINITY_DN169_c2_g1~~TRINITY_DN169_c2_g1_i1.p1  ORF type:complete len:799 (+),score=222.59 TRINITY_DN169_c2_g1_i1:321-2399(+)
MVDDQQTNEQSVKQYLDIISSYHPNPEDKFVVLVGCKSDLVGAPSMISDNPSEQSSNESSTSNSSASSSSSSSSAPGTNPSESNTESAPKSESESTPSSTESAPASGSDSSASSSSPTTDSSPTDNTPTTTTDAPPPSSSSSNNTEQPFISAPENPITPSDNCVSGGGGMMSSTTTFIFNGEKLAQEYNITYFEVSSKNNQKVESVFHTGLLSAYKYFISQKSKQSKLPEKNSQEKIDAVMTSIQNGVHVNDILNDDDDVKKDTFYNLFMNSEYQQKVVEYMATKDNLLTMIDYMFFDKARSAVVISFRDFAISLFEKISTNSLIPIYKSILSNDDVISKLFTLFFDRPSYNSNYAPPVRRIIFRIINVLTDQDTPKMINHINKTKIISSVLTTIDYDDVKDFFAMIVNSEVKAVISSNHSLELSLLENADLPTLLHDSLESGSVSIDSVSLFFAMICALRGSNSAIIYRIMTENNYKFPSLILNLSTKPETCHEATSFFVDWLLKVVIESGTTYPDMHPGVEDLLNNQKIYIESVVNDANSSTSSEYSILLLIAGCLKWKLYSFVKPYIKYCLDVLFKHPNCSVIHFSATSILKNVFNAPTSSLTEELMQNDYVINRILDAFKSKTTSYQYYGHLITIANSMISSAHYKEQLKSSQEWNNFVETTLNEENNKSEIASRPERGPRKGRGFVL